MSSKLTFSKLRVRLENWWKDPRSKRNSLLFLLSVGIVLYCEWFYQYLYFYSYSWPLNNAEANIVLLADPQVVDRNSYPNRNNIGMKLSEIMSDRYLARNFRLIDKFMKPDAYFFLGDLFDGGREWDDEAWFAEFDRFCRIFPYSELIPRVTSLPGNHDVGSANTINKLAFERFEKYFGETTTIKSIADHNIVMLDTNAMMDSADKEISGKIKEFYKILLDNSEVLQPLIILSHVPLYRPDGSDCGPNNEREVIRLRMGYQYVTMVDAAISTDILRNLNPDFVFSGDHHDICEYVHELPDKNILETTVKTFSMAGGMQRPGFQVISLNSGGTSATNPVLLPKPFSPFFILGGLYAMYTVLVIVTAIRTPKKKLYTSLPISVSDKHRTYPRKSHRFYDFLTMAGIGISGFVVGQIIIERLCYGGMR